MAEDQDIGEQLDTIIALLKIGFAGEVEALRNRLSQDAIMRELLEAAAAPDGVTATALVDAVVSKTSAGRSTVRQRLADLGALGALRGSRAGTSIRYRSTGVL